MQRRSRSVVLWGILLLAAVWIPVMLAQWTRFDRTPLIIGVVITGAATLLAVAIFRGRRGSA